MHWYRCRTVTRSVVYLSVCWAHGQALQKRLNRSRCRLRADGSFDLLLSSTLQSSSSSSSSSERIAKQHSSRSNLWQSLSKLLRRDDDKSRPATARHTADDFSGFFHDKVKLVRDSTANCPPPTSSRRLVLVTNSSLTELLVCSEDDVRRVIMSSTTNRVRWIPSRLSH